MDMKNISMVSSFLNEFLSNSISFSGKLFTFQNQIYSIYLNDNHLYLFDGTNTTTLQSNTPVDKILYVFVDTSSIYVTGSNTSNQGFYLKVVDLSGSPNIQLYEVNTTIPEISCFTKFLNYNQTYEYYYFYSQNIYLVYNNIQYPNTITTYPIKNCFFHNNTTYLISEFFNNDYKIEITKLTISYNQFSPTFTSTPSILESNSNHLIPSHLGLFNNVPTLFYTRQQNLTTDITSNILLRIDLSSDEINNYYFSNTLFIDRLFVSGTTGYAYGYSNGDFKLIALNLSNGSFTTSDLISLFYDGDNTVTGTVYYYRGTNPSINLSLDGSFIDTVSTNNGLFVYEDSYFTPGSHTLTASYTGADDYLQSEKSISIQVNTISTTLSLTGPTTSIEGSSVQFKVNVSNPNYSIDSGLIYFYDGATLLGSSSLTSTGSASFTANNLSLGSHTILSLYTGPSIYQSSTGSINHKVTYGVGQDGKVSSTILSYPSLTPFVFTDPQNTNISQTATIFYGSTGTLSSGTGNFLDVNIPINSYLSDKKIIFSPVSTSTTSAVLVFKIIDTSGSLISSLDSSVVFTTYLDKKLNNIRQNQNFSIKDGLGNTVGSATYISQSTVNGVTRYRYNCSVSSGAGSLEIASPNQPFLNTGNVIGTTVNISIDSILYFGENQEWRIRTVQTTNEDRLLFEYYEENVGWVVGVPFIIK